MDSSLWELTIKNPSARHAAMSAGSAELSLSRRPALSLDGVEAECRRPLVGAALAARAAALPGLERRLGETDGAAADIRQRIAAAASRLTEIAAAVAAVKADLPADMAKKLRELWQEREAHEQTRDALAERLAALLESRGKIIRELPALERAAVEAECGVQRGITPDVRRAVEARIASVLGAELDAYFAALKAEWMYAQTPAAELAAAVMAGLPRWPEGEPEPPRPAPAAAPPARAKESREVWRPVTTARDSDAQPYGVSKPVKREH